MKRADKPTQWLLIDGTTNSEWDLCNSALVHLTPEMLKLIETAVKGATAFKVEEEYFFRGLQFWAYPYAWLNLDELGLDDNNQEEIVAALKQPPGYVYLELDKEEANRLERPEQDVDSETLKTSPEGTMQFVGYGSNTGEEFWTSEIMGTEILKDFGIELQSQANEQPAIKILIDTRGGEVQAVNCNRADARIVIIDWDEADIGEKPVSGILEPDHVCENMWELYNDSTDAHDMEARDELKTMTF